MSAAKKTLYIVPIEPLENRYTKHWFDYVPKQMKDFFGDDINVAQVNVAPSVSKSSDGAFLNFSATVDYKSRQMAMISDLFSKNTVNDGDMFLFMDAWNPIATMVRYMSYTLGVHVHMAGIWHAGSYDPHDILGQIRYNQVPGSSSWFDSIEGHMASLYNIHIFATEYHKDLFMTSYQKDMHGAAFVAGFPMEYYDSKVSIKPSSNKRDLIVFPHRISEEKKPDAFRDLAKRIPEYEFVLAQEKNLSKQEYHDLLGEAKIVWSANLQETLGIGMFEGCLAGCLPVLPNKLSYVEMYPRCFRYDCPDGLNLRYHAKSDEDLIREFMENYDKWRSVLDSTLPGIKSKFFNGTELYAILADYLT